MAERKNASDRHKPGKQARVRGPFVDPMEELAALQGTDFTEMVNQAVREFLERKGLWPPPQAKDK